MASSSFRFLTLFAILALSSVAHDAGVGPGGEVIDIFPYYVSDHDNKHHHGTCPGGTSARTEAEMQMMYEEWLARQHEGRAAYNSLGKKEKRFEIFKDTVRFVDERNSVDRTYKVPSNRFAYLSSEEYRERYLGAGGNPPIPDPSTVCEEGHSCPEGTTCCCAAMLYPDHCVGWTCCPYQSATCCDDWETCCPQDYPVCDTDAGTCLMSKSNPLGIRALRRESAIKTPVSTARKEKHLVERLIRI